MEYEGVWQVYRTLKNFPKSRTNTVEPTRSKGNYIFWHFVVYGILPSIALIVLILTVITYEIIFRSTKDSKTYNEKSNDKKVDYYQEYYSIPENQMGRNVYAPLISVVVFILFGALITYNVGITKTQ